MNKIVGRTLYDISSPDEVARVLFSTRGSLAWLEALILYHLFIEDGNESSAAFYREVCLLTGNSEDQMLIRPTPRIVAEAWSSQPHVIENALEREIEARSEGKSERRAFWSEVVAILKEKTCNGQ